MDRSGSMGNAIVLGGMGTRGTRAPTGGAFILYDAIGAEVMRFMVPNDQFHVPFSTAQLAPALYHYQVLGNTGIVGEGKLSIIR